MLDFLNACLAARVVARPRRMSALGRIRGRDAVVRLGIAFALVAILVGALDRQASGTTLPATFEVAAGWSAM